METKNTIKKYEEVLEGVATLFSEQPKETNTSDLEKSQFRLDFRGTKTLCETQRSSTT